MVEGAAALHQVPYSGPLVSTRSGIRTRGDLNVLIYLPIFRKYGLVGLPDLPAPNNSQHSPYAVVFRPVGGMACGFNWWYGVQIQLETEEESRFTSSMPTSRGSKRLESISFLPPEFEQSTEPPGNSDSGVLGSETYTVNEAIDHLGVSLIVPSACVDERPLSYWVTRLSSLIMQHWASLYWHLICLYWTAFIPAAQLRRVWLVSRRADVLFWASLGG